MQFLEYRISPDDSKIHDSCAGWSALRAQNYSQGVLLPGLPFYLEQPGRAHDRPALASLLSRERIWNRSLVGETVWRRLIPSTRFFLLWFPSRLGALSFRDSLGFRSESRPAFTSHEVGFRIAAGVDHLRRRRLVRLQQL